MVWTKDDILKALKRLYKQKADLSYNALAAKRQPLVSAGADHLRPHRTAVERGGADAARAARHAAGRPPAAPRARGGVPRRLVPQGGRAGRHRLRADHPPPAVDAADDH